MIELCQCRGVMHQTRFLTLLLCTSCPASWQNTGSPLNFTDANPHLRTRSQYKQDEQ